MATSSARKYLQAFVFTFEDMICKHNLAKFKVGNAATHLTKDVQKICFFDQMGEETYDQQKTVVFTNVETACHGIRLKQK